MLDVCASGVSAAALTTPVASALLALTFNISLLLLLFMSKKLTKQKFSKKSTRFLIGVAVPLLVPPFMFTLVALQMLAVRLPLTFVVVTAFASTFISSTTTMFVAAPLRRLVLCVSAELARTLAEPPAGIKSRLRLLLEQFVLALTELEVSNNDNEAWSGVALDSASFATCVALFLRMLLTARSFRCTITSGTMRGESLRRMRSSSASTGHTMLAKVRLTRAVGGAVVAVCGPPGLATVSAGCTAVAGGGRGPTNALAFVTDDEVRLAEIDELALLVFTLFIRFTVPSKSNTRFFFYP